MVLTKGSDVALEVSDHARKHLKPTSAAVGEFARQYEESVGLKADIMASSDPRAVATAVDAQVQSLTSSLVAGGKPSSCGRM